MPRTATTRPKGRGYSWASAKPGDRLALTHGAYSEASIAPLARELVSGVVAASAYLAEPQYRATLEAWARSEAQVEHQPQP